MNVNQEIMKETHIVLKNDDIDKYLDNRQKDALREIVISIGNGRKREGKNPFNSYYICNVDEPYADKVKDVILKAENDN